MYNADPNYMTYIVGGTFPKPIPRRGGKPITSTKGTYPSLLSALQTCGIKLN